MTIIIQVRPIADIQDWPETYVVPEGEDPDAFADRILAEAVYPIEVHIAIADPWQSVRRAA